MKRPDKCLGCIGGSLHHTCGQLPSAVSASDSNELLASVPFTEDSSIRFWASGGVAEHKGEKIYMRFDIAGGISIDYKKKTYRITPENILGGVIDVIDGTHHGS